MDVSLGPYYIDSIEVCQNLLKSYGVMGSYHLAINFQEKAIEAWEAHGPSAVDELKEAHRLLEQLKTKASGLSDGNVMKAMPLAANSSEASFSSTSQVGVSAIERQRSATKMLNQ